MAFALGSFGVAYLTKTSKVNDGVVHLMNVEGDDLIGPEVERLLSPETFRSLSSKLYTWGKSEPAACILWCDEHFIRDLTPNVVEASARQLVKQDLKSLQRVYIKLKIVPHLKIVRERIREAIVALASEDPAESFKLLSQWVPESDGDADGSYGAVFVQWLAEDPETAISFAGRSREFEGIIMSAVQNAVTSGVLDVARLENISLPDAMKASLFAAVSMGLVGVDAAKGGEAVQALEFANRIPVWTELGLQCREASYRRLMLQDQNGALEAIRALPPARGDAALTYLARFAATEEVFLAIADSMSDPRTRVEAVVKKTMKSETEDFLSAINGNIDDPYELILAGRILARQSKDRAKLLEAVELLEEGPLKSSLRFNAFTSKNDG